MNMKTDDKQIIYHCNTLLQRRFWQNQQLTPSQKEGVELNLFVIWMIQLALIVIESRKDKW